MMTLLEAIDARHSVRRYISRPLEREAVDCLRAKIDECNSKGNLHIQLVLNERKGFSGMLAYGSFSGVENYIVMAGRRADDLDERVGYYGADCAAGSAAWTWYMLGWSVIQEGERCLRPGF